ncbi:DUF6612 family protein [Saccharibacillus endophyticus]|uniref:LppX_LprAFG lipoprotein n=1 Tax=Saccharibacillus endophyticus TaxID=2060666 RepID=A0ABQ1ZQ10_9BACL|nr:DUF6612 family protein [Saccharibacillus endophyticus]GGH71093.1 hypothetical protein GCM10007362_07850 [Saccharibacillus endophyticus]
MKKLWTAVFSAMLVVSITACGNNEETATTETPAATDTTAPAEAPAAEATETPAAEEPAAEASSMSAEELLNKAQEATKELKSYNMVANIDQSMTLNGEENTSKTNMNTDIVLDPAISGYQEIKTDAAGASTDIKQYITADAVYMEVEGQWRKLPEEQRSQMMATLESGSNLESSFDQFKSVASDMKVTEEGDDYVLTASLSGDKIKSMASDMLGGSDEQSAAALDQMNIEEMNLTYALNKETFYPTKSLIDMTMSAESGEGDQAMSMSMHMVMDSTISKHNEIEAITVPQDVVDSAQ